MKKLFLLFIFCMFAATGMDAAQRVGGYTKRNGTHVMSHHRSYRDSSRHNNYSTKGNYNPYTGKKGSKSPYKTKSYRTKRR